MSKGRTLFPVRETDVPDLKKGAGQTNSLEVQTVGNKATLFVNGTKIAEFNGKPPEGGGLIGLETYSAKGGGETEARFTNFVVAEPKYLYAARFGWVSRLRGKERPNTLRS